MSYYDNQEAKVKISIELEKRGWKIFGFREDQSDSMTDYWCPASWSAGIATKNGYVLIVDQNNTHYSGYEVKKYDYSKQQNKYKSNARIDKLTAMMNDAASTENEKASCATLIEKEIEKLGVKTEATYTVLGTYPAFQHGNPKACNWHIEFNGQIIAKGKGAFAVNSYDWEDKTKTAAEQKAEKLNAFINKIETAIKQDSALESEVIKVPKTVIKPVEIETKNIVSNEINDNTYFIMKVNYTHGNNKGTMYKCDRASTIENSDSFVFAKIGKNNKPSKTKTWYLSTVRINEMLTKGHIAIVEMKEFTEYEEKTIYKKTAKKQPKSNFEVNAIVGDVTEVTEEEVQTEANNNANNNDQVTINFNKEKNGIEIKFTSKPSKNTIDALKENGFRWFQPLGFWCAKQTPERLEFAQSLFNNTTEEQPQEEQETAPEAHNSTTETNQDELMVEHLADSLTDYIIACGKPQTDEEKEKAIKHILGYMISREMEPTEGMLQYMQNEYPFLYSIVTHNSSTKTEPTQTEKDPYTFTVDTSFTYHDIHFKAWNMEISEIEEFMNAYEIPFYISCDKFIFQGLTLDQVATVEEINKLNAAIIFYDNKYNEIAESAYNSSTPEEPQSTITPFEYGAKAFERGISCAPALDNEFLETHIKGLKVGEGGVELMKEWVKGWTKANLDTPFDFTVTDSTYNSDIPSEPDNVVYYNFGSTQAQEEEIETINNFDDILSKFDNIEVTADSKISAEDLEFCKEQENIFKELVKLYNSFISQLQPIIELDKEHGEKFKYKINDYTHKHDTAYYHSLKPSDMNKNIEAMKNRFINSVCYYFMKKYNVTIDYEKIQKKYDTSVTYENIIDEITIQLGGYNFTEKAEKEIKDKLKKELEYKEATPKGNKLILNKFLYIDDSWKKWGDEKIHYNSTSKLEQLFKALQHFENGSTTLSEELQALYRQLANGKNEVVFDTHEVTCNKFSKIKILKNGKVEIEFSSSHHANNFSKEYCSNVA